MFACSDNKKRKREQKKTEAKRLFQKSYQQVFEKRRSGPSFNASKLVCKLDYRCKNFTVMMNFDSILNKTIDNLKIRQVYEPRLKLIVSKLEKLKMLIEDGEQNIKQNPIRGITRAYLDIFSDYDNPILKDLYFLDKEAEKIIEE